MHRGVRILIGLCCVVLLLVIRFRESELFYDPLVGFFKSDYNTAQLPALASVRFYVNLTLRFVLNTICSIGLIYVVYLKMEIIKLSFLIYLIVFVIGMIVVWYAVDSYEVGDYMLLFYSRRFVIQPLLLFVLFPAYYYHKKVAMD